MLSRINEIATRHRRKLVISGLAVGGMYVAMKYAQRKVIEFQERQAREFFEKTRRIQHFESTERTCDQIIFGMGTELYHAILEECSTADLLQQLRKNPPNKIILWEELKIMSFTRLTTFIYASSLLVITLRVQMNILGGYLYRDIKTDNSNQGIPDAYKEHYLSLIRYFIHDGGLRDLIRFIRHKITEVIKHMPLSQTLTLGDLEQLFWSLQMTINGDVNSDPVTKMFKYVMPSELSSDCNLVMHKMFNETLDLLESEDASGVCTNNICRGFSLAVDAIAENLGEMLAQRNQKNSDVIEKVSEIVNGANVSVDGGERLLRVSMKDEDAILKINSTRLALAKIVPILCGLTSKGYDSKLRPQNLATSLLTFFVISEKTKMFGANIYETFSSTT